MLIGKMACNFQLNSAGVISRWDFGMVTCKMSGDSNI